MTHRNGSLLSARHSTNNQMKPPSAKPPTELINIVDVNAIVGRSNIEKRTNTEKQNQSKGICTECIVSEPKILGLKRKLDQLRQQLIELEKENELLKSQLNTNTPKPSKRNENCRICSATLTQRELDTHTCIDLDAVICENCSKSFQSTNDLWNHLNDSTVHCNKEWHRCSTCLKTFPAAVLLKCHKDVEHPQTKCN